MAEHSAVNRRVVGSSPTCGAKKLQGKHKMKATVMVAFRRFVLRIVPKPLGLDSGLPSYHCYH